MTKDYMESLPKCVQPHEPPRFSLWQMLLLLPFIVLYLGIGLCIAAGLVLILPYLLVTWAYSVGGIFASIFVAWLYVSVLIAIVDY